MLSATLTAARRLCDGTSFGVSVKKMAPHTTGLMTARTVTTACTIWCRLEQTLLAGQSAFQLDAEL